MNIYFGFILRVGTEVLMHFRVFFSFSRCWVREPNHFKAKNETRRTTKTFKKNPKIFPKH